MQTEKLVSIIRSCTEEVFTMMLGLDAKCGEPQTVQDRDEVFDGVVSLVGLAGAWVGSGRISCSANFACVISGAMLASEYASVNEEVLDAMAELTNMIIGNVKTKIEDDYGPMGLSIPTVVFGRNYRARNGGGGSWTVVPFHYGEERMDVKICLVPGHDTASHPIPSEVA